MIYIDFFHTYVLQAHGFEILCSKCTCHKENQNTNGHGLSQDEIRWQRYLKSLTKHGYFRVSTLTKLPEITH